MELVYLVIGLAAGAAGAFLYAKNKYSTHLLTRINDLSIEKAKVEASARIHEDSVKRLTDDLKNQNNKFLELSNIYSSVKADYLNLKEKLSEQKNEVEKLQQKFTLEFENIANRLLEEKSKKFTEQNKTNIDDILRPLSEKIRLFEKKVEDVYISDTKDRAGLLQQIKSLHDLNLQMSKDANNLTQALKGQSKVQGNWGEFILESVLEKSGLVKDREYKIQESHRTEEGRRLQPDIIINLPDSKCLIIDSKVSLTAYEKYCSCETETDRIIAMKEHIVSIRRHITNLSSKNYHSLYSIKSLDFVLLFMPIEPAFSVAVQNDPDIFNEAFEKNIVIVSPSTLLATLRTIASIWRQENQNRNALEIARQSGALYDKFVNMIADLTEIGKKLRSVEDNYEDIMKKLYTGKGNLLMSVEKIKKLGAKTNKSLPANMLDKIEEEDSPELLEENSSGL